jgi:hypothetical protein
MRPLLRNSVEHRAARALRDESSIRRENDGLCSVMAVGREQFIGSDLRRLRGLMRPLSLGLIGLAVAIVIWGFAYKLSLYQPHPSHTAKISVAKLWLGPEGNSLTAKSAKFHLQPRGNLDVAFVPQHSIPLHSQNGSRTASKAAFTVKTFFTDCPPRSPPTEDI